MSKLKIGDNTIINAPGKNVTHGVSLSGSFTGTLHWCVFNGICVVSLVGVKPASSGVGQTVYSSLPKCNQYAAVTTSDNANAFYINKNETILRMNANNTSAQTLQMIYPVASDWEE